MTLPAAEIDQQWIDASKKYDATRNQILQRVDDAGAEGPFHPDWKSLSNYSAPDWYRDAKFGIFIHWGVYSVPAFDSEWYPRNMYIEGSSANKHQVATYGPLTKFGYKDFIPMFRAEKFDPEAWARLFADAGAKYVVPVFEHHDGFTMYDSSLSDWTAVKMGPKRDLDGELARAVRAQDFISARRHIAWSTTGSTTEAARPLPMSTIRRMQNSTVPRRRVSITAMT